MGSQMLCEDTQRRIGDDGNLADLPVVVPHEAEVARDPAPIFPAGKTWRLQDRPRSRPAGAMKGSTVAARPSKSSLVNDAVGRTCSTSLSLSNV